MIQVLFDCSGISDLSSLLGVDDPELLYALIMWVITLLAKTDMPTTLSCSLHPFYPKINGMAMGAIRLEKTL